MTASARPSRSHKWGAIEIQNGIASLSRAQWFPERHLAVEYARKTFGRQYALARAWDEGPEARGRERTHDYAAATDSTRVVGSPAVDIETSFDHTGDRP
jgi:hypothetical protein